LIPDELTFECESVATERIQKRKKKGVFGRSNVCKKICEQKKLEKLLTQGFKSFIFCRANRALVLLGPFVVKKSLGWKGGGCKMEGGYE